VLTPIKQVDLDDITEALPAFLTAIMMPFTFSIADGIVFGVLSYVFLKVLTGRSKEVPLFTYLIGILFICKFVFM